MTTSSSWFRRWSASSASDVRIGFFNHIPFPGYEIFAQLPWRRQVVNGLLGADLLGFQRRADATNFLRACRRAAGLVTRGATVRVGDREVRAAAFPISIDAAALEQIARQESVRKRAAEIRRALDEPETVLLGIDRLDYTKGIPHRLRAYGELLRDGPARPASGPGPGGEPEPGAGRGLPACCATRSSRP